MANEPAAQSHHDSREEENFPPTPETGMSDGALLEDALSAAIEAHRAGHLVAPFGIDEVALTRARRRALRADIKRLIQHRENSPHSDNP
jgi:hypothetical protein